MSDSGVLVLGSANVDLCVYVARAPGPGETVMGGRFARAHGGKGANQAVAARRAGAAVRFAGCVGNDELGSEYRAHLEAEGIDASLLREAAGEPTGCALITIDGAGENAIAVAPGANDAVTPADVAGMSEAIGSAGLLVMQMELSPSTTAAALQVAAERGVAVVLNYAPIRGVPVAVSEAVTHLVVNQIEAGQLLGEASEVSASAASAAAARLRAMGPSAVTITLGGAGLVTAWDGGEARLGAHAVEVVDTTAAGDTFCGYLAAGLARGATQSDAAALANAAAALAVTRRGAQPSIPTRDEVVAFIEVGQG